ncbi:MAG: hypothetical protein EOP06_17240 [Proteobacteria bacterium]|nr:MAG: hypothetical protein EOP06_17240 [Pseudomonadota bacterium]
MKFFSLRFPLLILTLSLGLAGCGLNSEVTFKEPAPLGAKVEVAPGLGVANGGYFRQSTYRGNQASLSVGAQTKELTGTTQQGHKFYLNVIGQQSQ